MNKSMARVCFFTLPLAFNVLVIFVLMGQIDSFPLFFFICLFCLVLGLFLKFMVPHENAIIRNLAWGLISSSLTTIIATVVVIIYVAYLYSN